MKRSTSNSTDIHVMFSKGSIYVEKEDWAYPFTSVLADFGGVLGLFLGFNFLMIWDIIVYVITKIKKH